MSTAGQQRSVWIWVAVAGIAVAWLSWPLNPRGFVAGDPGVKLIAARNAVAHPSRPFQVDLPAIAGRPAPFVDRLFVTHGDHAHALQSPLFPVMAAPLIAIGGLRWAYLIPALGFLALLPLARAASRSNATGISITALGVSVVLAHPMFFYAFEFWEHVPAIAVLAAATALASAALRASATRSRIQGAASGALAGVSVMLRPEAVWYAVALGCWLIWRRAGRFYALGLGVVLTGFCTANYVENGSLLGAHASANLSTLADRWWDTRLSRLALWLAPPSLVFAAGAAGLAAAWIDRVTHGSTTRAQAIGLAGATVIAVGSVAGHYPVESLWRAWPLGAIALVPLRTYKGLGLFVWLACATSVAVWLSSTHDGGAQWGPRIFMISAPALVIVAAAALDQGAEAGPNRGLRALLLVLLVGCGVWSSRAAYVELRGWKRVYGTLVSRMEQQTEPGSYILTNVWWLDQICAPLYGTRTFLVAESAREFATIVRQLQSSGVRSLYVAWSSEDADSEPISLDGSCYDVEQSVAIPERSLHVSRLRCRE